MDNNGKELNAGQEEGNPPTPTKERTCLICGCTDSSPCEGGCGWVIMLSKQTDICSKCITDTVPQCIDLLIEVILLTHRDEIDAKHHGDETCSTCNLIGIARKIEGALRQ